MATHPSNTVTISRWKGLNNTADAPKEFLQTADNVDLDKLGNMQLRKGYTLLHAGDYSSLYGSDNQGICLANKNGNLISINSAYVESTLKSNVGSSEIRYAEIGDSIYFCSPHTSGVIDKTTGIRTWGLPKTTVIPTLSQGTGTLYAGTYTVTLTSSDASGFESGTSTFSQITIASNKGITFTLPAAPEARVVAWNVYVSTVNGNKLFYHGRGVPGNSYTISDVSTAVAPIRSFNMDQPPALGENIAYYNGRIYVSVDRYLYWTEKYEYEWINYVSNYLELPSPILEVLPVDNGIWLCAEDAIYYASGNEPSEFNVSLKEYVKVVRGTSSKVSGSYIHMDNTPIGYKWLVTTNSGIFVLFNQGLVLNLTATNLNIDQADSGTATFIQNNGRNNYVSVLKKNDQPNNAFFGDLVEAVIVRNGVTLPT